MSFSLFQEKPPEDTPSDPQNTASDDASENTGLGAVTHRLRVVGGRVAERLRASVPESGRWNSFSVILAFIALVALVFGIHEQRVAAHLQDQRVAPAARALPPVQESALPAQQRSPEEERLAAQINALNAKLDSITQAQAPAQPVVQPAVQPVAKPAATHARVRRPEPSDVTVIHRVPKQPKPDPRWKKVQDQLDAQGRQIDSQGKQIESTRQEIASTRTDLQGSIAKTHEELVVLQKKGERNYFEFSLDKSKSFRGVGPVEVSLRKANTKNQYADLKLIVDDREISKKHLNLYEPAVFYLSDEHQPLELVINTISKNHIRGYISAAKYRSSELQVGSTGAAPSTGNAPETAATKPRQKLVEAPR